MNARTFIASSLICVFGSASSAHAEAEGVINARWCRDGGTNSIKVVAISGSAPVSIRRAAPVETGNARAVKPAHTSTILGTRSKARRSVGSTMCRGEARRGRAGQAFELGEPGVADGTTANSLAADCRGPRQDDQTVKTKPLARGLLADSGPGPGANEPALQGTDRSNGPAQWQG